MKEMSCVQCFMSGRMWVLMNHSPLQDNVLPYFTFSVPGKELTLVISKSSTLVPNWEFSGKSILCLSDLLSTGCPNRLPWCLSSKESACNAGDPGSILGLGRSPEGGHADPLYYSCLENPTDRGALDCWP